MVFHYVKTDTQNLSFIKYKNLLDDDDHVLKIIIQNCQFTYDNIGHQKPQAIQKHKTEELFYLLI